MLVVVHEAKWDIGQGVVVVNLMGLWLQGVVRVASWGPT